jgi:hypothetical protein
MAMAGHGLSHPPFLSLSDGFIEIIEDESRYLGHLGTIGWDTMGVFQMGWMEVIRSLLGFLTKAKGPSICDWTSAMIELVDLLVWGMKLRFMII